MTLTVTELRGHVDTTLEDTPLQLLLDAAYQTIGQRVEPSGTVSELLSGRGDLLMLSRVATGIVSIAEYWPGLIYGGTDRIVLDTSDYEVRMSGQTLRRLWTGNNPSRYWRGRVDVTYLSGADDALRDSVAVQLVKLDVNTHPGLSEQSLGAWSEKYDARAAGTYQAQRDAILNSLDSVGIML